MQSSSMKFRNLMLFCYFLSSASTPLQFSPEYKYNGQVYLFGASHEYYKGSLKVRLSDEYHTVCVDNFNMQAAISICRQLGYSSGTYHAGETYKLAITYGMMKYFSSLFYRDTIRLTNILCNDNTGSFPCFSQCGINNEGYILSF